LESVKTAGLRSPSRAAIARAAGESEIESDAAVDFDVLDDAESTDASGSGGDTGGSSPLAGAAVRRSTVTMLLRLDWRDAR
jgi:hypothetical protein